MSPAPKIKIWSHTTLLQIQRNIRDRDRDRDRERERDRDRDSILKNIRDRVVIVI